MDATGQTLAFEIAALGFLSFSVMTVITGPRNMQTLSLLLLSIVLAALSQLVQRLHVEHAEVRMFFTSCCLLCVTFALEACSWMHALHTLCAAQGALALALMSSMLGLFASVMQTVHRYGVFSLPCDLPWGHSKPKSESA